MTRAIPNGTWVTQELLYYYFQRAENYDAKRESASFLSQGTRTPGRQKALKLAKRSERTQLTVGIIVWVVKNGIDCLLKW